MMKYHSRYSLNVQCSETMESGVRSQKFLVTSRLGEGHQEGRGRLSESVWWLLVSWKAVTSAQSEDAFTEEEDTDGAEDNDDISTHSLNRIFGPINTALWYGVRGIKVFIWVYVLHKTSAAPRTPVLHCGQLSGQSQRNLKSTIVNLISYHI